MEIKKYWMEILQERKAPVRIKTQLTSYKSIKTDLINAGADWKDEEVVVDNKLITSRSPKDLPAFCEKMIVALKEGSHA
jgi:protease I